MNWKNYEHILELNCPVWNAGLSEHDCRVLERVQRTAVAIIRGDSGSKYSDRLESLKLETLKIRRTKLCLKFAIKASKHPKFKNWFCKTDTLINTRSDKPPLKEVKTRTKRYKKSPLPYLTNLLNNHLNQ